MAVREKWIDVKDAFSLDPPEQALVPPRASVHRRHVQQHAVQLAEFVRDATSPARIIHFDTVQGEAACEALRNKYLALSAAQDDGASLVSFVNRTISSMGQEITRAPYSGLRACERKEVVDALVPIFTAQVRQGHEEETMHLTDSLVTVGRHAESTIVADRDPYVSRVHLAALVMKDKENKPWLIGLDSWSLNGTTLSYKNLSRTLPEPRSSDGLDAVVPMEYAEPLQGETPRGSSVPVSSKKGTFFALNLLAKPSMKIGSHTDITFSWTE